MRNDFYVEIPPTPPMPEIRQALLSISDAKGALSGHIWNKAQLINAINSAEYFLKLAREEIK